MNDKNALLTNTYKWIPWVTALNSWKDGPTVAIFSLTHGNEPAWLEAQVHLLQHCPHLQKGKILLITVNHRAYHEYRVSKKTSVGRFVDVNMNRIGNFLDHTEAYEYKRFQELATLFDEIDVALDIHSTSQKQWSLMGICHTHDLVEAQKVLLTDRILIDDNFDTFGSLMSFFARQHKLAIGIECGSHSDTTARQNALQNILRLLSHTGLLHDEVPRSKKEVFRFYQEVFPLSQAFHYTQKRNNFDKIPPGTIYAEDSGVVYKNDTLEDVYIGIIWNDIRLGDGICFLFRKLET